MKGAQPESVWDFTPRRKRTRKTPTTRLGSSVSLVVDSREPKTIDEILTKVGFEVSRQAMETGDYLWVTRDGRVVCVERKTVPDLLSSLSDRQANGKTRLQNQMTRLLEMRVTPILLIEGDITCSADGFVTVGKRKTGWYWDSVDNSLVSLQRAGVIVVRAPRSRLAERLVTLVNYFDKRSHGLLNTSSGGGTVIEPAREGKEDECLHETRSTDAGTTPSPT